MKAWEEEVEIELRKLLAQKEALEKELKELYEEYERVRLNNLKRVLLSWIKPKETKLMIIEDRILELKKKLEG